MRKSHLFILGVSFTLGLLALSWCHAQTPRHRTKVIDPTTGKEIHTLFLDQQNALVAQLEEAGQTNALELFREYRCAYGADSTSSELGYVVAALLDLREGRTNQAIQVLEQRLVQCSGMMCYSYGGLSPTNRERVQLDSLKQAQDYFDQFPPPAWGGDTAKAVKEVLRRSAQKSSK